MTDHDETPDGGYELEVPFVVCDSAGGPYEDDAFCAGFAAGRIDQQLKLAAELAPLLQAVHVGDLEFTVLATLLDQLDLIAMRHGFTMVSEPSEELPEWTHVRFVRTSQETPA